MWIPLNDLTWPRRTERLLLRRATRADVAAIGSIRAIDGVSEWLTVDASNSERFAAHFERSDRLDASIVVQLDGEVVGDLMFKSEEAWAQAEVEADAVGVQAELGWVIHPAYGGRGLATEAVRALLPIGFDELDLRRIVAFCFADNEPSWRLMERVGMRREMHTRSDALHRSGRWLDGYGYAIIADDWRRRS